MSTINVFLCENGRYYIRKTCSLHVDDNEWTRKYKPIKIVEQIHNADELDEDNYTKKYMRMYGIENVRGGTYYQIELSESCILELKNELCSASILCFRCNRSGHFAAECYAVTTVNGSLIDDDSSYDDESWDFCEEFSSDKEVCSPETVECKSPSTKTSFFPKLLTTARKVVEYFFEDEAEEKRCTCFRCGRSGHYADECFAMSHVDGRRLM